MQTGRYVQDLPNKKIGEVDKNAQSAFCSPAKCLEDVHNKMLEYQGKDVNSQETIIQGM